MKKYPEVLLTIDPSTTATGWAFTEITKDGDAPRISPIRNALGVVEPQGADWIARSLDTRWFLQKIVRPWRKARVLSEIPETWQGITGRAAALSGTVLKLGFVAGAMVDISEFALTKFVSVREWKGQTPKAVTRLRVREFFGHDEPNEHICDALGIARWFYRSFKE